MRTPLFNFLLLIPNLEPLGETVILDSTSQVSRTILNIKYLDLQILNSSEWLCE